MIKRQPELKRYLATTLLSIKEIMSTLKEIRKEKDFLDWKLVIFGFGYFKFKLCRQGDITIPNRTNKLYPVRIVFVPSTTLKVETCK